MTTFSLPHFGELDYTQLEEYYDVDITYHGQEVQLDLIFDGERIDPERLNIVKQFIINIAELDRKNKQYIKQDYTDRNCDTVRNYLEHHLEELDEDELAGLINAEDPKTNPQIQLMNALKLVRMGLHPHSEEQFAIFDYSIGQDLTQYMVVIITDQEGNLDYMTIES